jgi:hypothetical protein
LPFLPPEKFSQEAYLWLSSLSSVASRKCGNFDRNGWKLCSVMTGNFAAESVETLERNNHISTAEHKIPSNPPPKGISKDGRAPSIILPIS